MLQVRDLWDKNELKFIYYSTKETVFITVVSTYVTYDLRTYRGLISVFLITVRCSVFESVVPIVFSPEICEGMFLQVLWQFIFIYLQLIAQYDMYTAIKSICLFATQLKNNQFVLKITSLILPTGGTL